MKKYKNKTDFTLRTPFPVHTKYLQYNFIFHLSYKNQYPKVIPEKYEVNQKWIMKLY